MSRKKKSRSQENMLDMSPTNSFSLIVADQFDGKGFVDQDLQYGVELRELDIQIDIARKRYEYLFGKPYVG
jgi:hypothetical protein